MSGVTNNWGVLAEAIRMERARRKWSQTDLGDKVGKSQATIKNLESARAYKTVPSGLLQDLDRAFEWPPGTLEEKLRAAGPVGPEPDFRIEAEEPTPTGDIVALIRSVVFDAVVTAAPDTPISQVREIEERALEAAARAGFGPPRRRNPTHTEDDPAT